MNKETIAYKAKQSYLWSSASRIFMLAFRILLAAVLARLVTPEAFGLYGTLFILTDLSRVCTSSFIQTTLILEAEERELTTAGFLIALVHSLVIAGLLLLFAGPVAAFFDHAELVRFLQVGGLIIILEAITYPLQGILEKRLEVHWVVKADMIATVLGSGILTLVLAAAGLQHWALLLGFLGYLVIKLLLLLVKRPIHVKRPEASHLRRVYRYSRSLILLDIANKIALKGDYFITSKFLGMQSLGFYTKAYHLMEIPTSLFGSGIDQVGLPTFSSLSNDFETIRHYFLRIVYLVFLLTFPVSVLLYFMGDVVVYILFGPQWGPTTAPFQILVFGMAFRLAYKIPNTILQAVRQFRALTIAQVLYAVLVIGLSYALRGQGTIGIAIAVLAALLATNLVTFGVTCRAIHIRPADMLAVAYDGVTVAGVLALTYWMLTSLLPYDNYVLRISIAVAATAAGGLAYWAKYRFRPTAYGQWVVNLVGGMLPVRKG